VKFLSVWSSTISSISSSISSRSAILFVKSSYCFLKAKHEVTTSDNSAQDIDQQVLKKIEN